MELWAIWVIIGLVALMIEIFTVGFAMICFTVGSLAAAVGAWFGVSGVWQLAIFSIVTLLSFVTVRPLVVQLFSREKAATNVDALIGRRAVVTQQIVNGEGRVSVDGDDWRAQIEDVECVVELGTRVEVVRVESVVLIIKVI